MLSGASVFIVEDEALIALEIKTRLMNFGYKIAGTAARGEAAIKEIARTKPNLVLMDIRLAGAMDGIDTAISLLGPDAPAVVFLSAYADDEVLQRVQGAQPYGYLVKPFSPRELHATLQAALYRSSLDRALRGLNARLESEVRARTAELSASESRLREAQSIARIGDWSAVRPDGPVYWSAALYKIFDRDPGTPPPSREEYLREVVFPDDESEVRSLLEPGLGVGRATSVEHRFCRSDGSIGWVRLEGRAAYDVSGTLVEIRGIVQDITDRKNNEIALNDLNTTLERRVQERTAELAESENRFRGLFDQAAVGVGEIDLATGRLVRVNCKLCEILGYTGEELCAMRFVELAHSDDAGPNPSDGFERLRSGEVQELTEEWRFLRKEGGVVWGSSTISFLRDLNGLPSRYIAVISDVTTRRRLDLAMHALSTDLVTLEGMEYVTAAARRLEDILDADIVTVTRFDRASPNRFETLVLIEDGKLIPSRYYTMTGKPCADVFAGEPRLIARDAANIYPSDSFLSSRAIAAYAAVPLTEVSGRIIGHLGIMRRKPFRNEESITAVLKMFAVALSAALVHERSRREYRDLFEFAPDGLVLSDPQGRIVLVNQQAENIFGWPRTELIGQSVEVLIPGNMRDNHMALREGFLQTPQRRRMAAERGSLLAMRKDGSVFPVEVDLAPVETDEGVMTAAAVRDISAREELEQQLAQAVKMDALGRLTGGMAHDFNNYLGVIIGNLDLLQGTEALTPAQQELVNSAILGAERSADLTRSLLSFARRQPLDARVTDVAPGIIRIAGLLRRTIGEDIVLNVELNDDLWLVKIDTAQLDSCIVNLANNARDAMPNGGILNIRASNVHLDQEDVKRHEGLSAGDYVLIEVIDTGEGISAENAARVFEPFFSTKSHGHGTGLGLSMVYGFVKQSGGHIRIFSEPEAGTAAQIYLPRTSESTRPSASASIFPTEDRANGETILVVEDNKDVRAAAVSQLISLGYRVVAAAGAEEALSILESADPQPDLMFSDVVMPGAMDGVALASLAAQRWPGLKIVLTSGFAGERMRDLGSEGSVAMLPKPYRMATLASTLRQALASGDD